MATTLKRRTFYKGVGLSEFLTALVVETNGANISGITVQMGYQLATDTGLPTPLAPDSDTSPATNKRQVATLLDLETLPAGVYELFVFLGDSPENTVRRVGAFAVI